MNAQITSRAFVAPGARERVARSPLPPKRSRDSLAASAAAPCATNSQGVEILARRLLRAQEEERLRIAVELHDGINQEVAMLSMELGVAISHISEQELKDRLVAIRNRAIRISEEIRRISHRLRPALIEYVGFVAAVRSHCRDMSENAGLRVDFMADDALQVPTAMATDLYRIVQEALQNVIRHASASTVVVNISERNGLITMCVEDNGVGLRQESQAAGKGMGLASMRERARSLGGDLNVLNILPHGTRVQAVIPAGGNTNED